MNEEINYSFCKPYITAGENILWRGTPGPGNLFTRQDIFLIPFSLFWTGGVVFIAFTILPTDAPLFSKFFLIPFLCVGFYILIGRFLWTAYLRKHTAYVITNQKIIRKQGNRIDIQGLANAPATHLEIHKDGFGTIAFGDPYLRNRNSNNLSFNTSQAVFTLDNIPNAVQIQQIILNAQQ